MSIRLPIRFIATALVVLVAALACAFAPALAQDPPAQPAQPDNGPVTLAWKFTKGETTTWRLKEVAVEETQNSSETVRQTQTTTITYTQTVEAVDAGIATLRLKYTSVKYEQQTTLNSATPVKFDSSNPEDIQRAESDLALKPFAALVGGSFTVKLTSLGEVKEVTGYSAMLERMFDGLNDEVFVQLKVALGKQFSDEAMKDTLGQLWRVVPDAAVTVGKSWNRKIVQPVMFIGRLQADQIYRLEKLDAVDGGTNAAIAVNTIYTRDDDGSTTPPGADALEGFRISGNAWSGNQKGTITFDVNAGKIRKSELNTELNVELTATSTGMAEQMQLAWSSKITGTVTLEQVKE
ncbi:MAG: DUF6263 family protein [Planctomycetota bacterium]